MSVSLRPSLPSLPTADDVRGAKKIVHFPDIIVDPDLKQLFIDFLEAEMMHENFLFWLDVEEYKTVSLFFSFPSLLFCVFFLFLKKKLFFFRESEFFFSNRSKTEDNQKLSLNTFSRSILVLTLKWRCVLQEEEELLLRRTEMLLLLMFLIMFNKMSMLPCHKNVFLDFVNLKFIWFFF